MSERKIPSLGKVVRMAKYYPNGTKPKEIDDYVDVGSWDTQPEGSE